MARKYFNWDPLALIVTRTTEGEDAQGDPIEVDTAYPYGFLGRADLYGLNTEGENEGELGENAIGPIVGVRKWDVESDGPFVPYMIEQLTATGIAQNYRISGGGKSALILVADDVSSAALSGPSGIIGKEAQIGATTITIASASSVQKASISV